VFTVRLSASYSSTCLALITEPGAPMLPLSARQPRDTDEPGVTHNVHCARSRHMRSLKTLDEDESRVGIYALTYLPIHVPLSIILLNSSKLQVIRRNSYCDVPNLPFSSDAGCRTQTTSWVVRTLLCQECCAIICQVIADQSRYFTFYCCKSRATVFRPGQVVDSATRSTVRSEEERQSRAATAGRS
jgi:hypothetical protein